MSPDPVTYYIVVRRRCYLDVKDLTVNRRLGRLTIELYDGVVPKTTANFSTLCRRRENELGYKGTQIFRIVPGLFCLAGDVEFSVGIGGVPAEPGQRYFDDENYALGHNAPGTEFRRFWIPVLYEKKKKWLSI